MSAERPGGPIDPRTGNWEVVRLARHPDRPHALNFIRTVFRSDGQPSFIEFHGDRASADDHAIVGGLASLEGQTVMVIGVQKGADAKENAPDQRNFGMSGPAGYRKALRLMKQAEKFGYPVITLIDTPGASPDAESEKGGIAWAISQNLYDMIRLKVPIIAVVIGEGGSGGALALGVADRIIVLENSYFSVVSPEGAASILWHDASFAPAAADALQLAGRNITRFLPFAQVLKEPSGGLHQDPEAIHSVLRDHLVKELTELRQMPVEKLLEERYQQFRNIGVFTDS